MPDTSMDALRKELQGAVPRGLGKLAPAERRHLAEAIRDARHHQQQALAEGGERALAHIPRLLRGPIRKIVG